MLLQSISLLGSTAGNMPSSGKCNKYRHYRPHKGVSFRLRFRKEFIKNHLISLQGGLVASILQFINVPIVDRHICSGQQKRSIYDGEICAGFSSGGKDACQVQNFCMSTTLLQVSCYRRGFSLIPLVTFRNTAKSDLASLRLSVLLSVRPPFHLHGTIRLPLDGFFNKI